MLDTLYNYITDGRLTISQVADFFDCINPEERNLFTFQQSDGTLIGIKEFFKAYHHNKTCRFRQSEKDTARWDFLRIYRGAAWSIIQIKKEMELLNELINLEKNWRDTTTHENDTDFTQNDRTTTNENNTHEEKRGLMMGNLTGQLDASQLSKVDVQNLLNCSKDKILGYLDPNTRSRSHQITIEGGQNTFTYTNNNNTNTNNAHKTKIKTTTHFSNSSRDIIDVINLKMPNLIENFLDKFNPLFLY